MKNVIITIKSFGFVGRYLPQNSHYVIGNIINSVLRNKDINIKVKRVLNLLN